MAILDEGRCGIYSLVSCVCLCCLTFDDGIKRFKALSRCTTYVGRQFVSILVSDDLGRINVIIFQPRRGIRISLANLGTSSSTFEFIYGLPIDSKYQVCSFYPSTYVGLKAMYVIHVRQKEEVYRKYQVYA
jgi:hypothetical protein